MTDLTAASAVITLVVPRVFDTPQQLQGFAADDIFSSAAIEAGEGSMGVDGKYSVGYIFKEVSQEYSLQADSDSNAIFDQWIAFERANLVKLPCGGTTDIPAINTRWVMTRGFLMTYTPIVAAGKTLKARKYEIRWNLVAPQPA